MAAAFEVARSLASRFAATAAEVDRRGEVPFDNLQELHAAGLTGLTVPIRYGGQGGTVHDAMAVAREIARGEGATALILAMQFIQHGTIHAPGSSWSEALRARVGRSAVEEGAYLNALRVEPELGTPQRGGVPATTARRAGDGWRLSGRKVYSTGSSALRWMIVWARTDEEPLRMGPFLVDARLPGIRIEPTWDHMGMTSSGSHDVLFEEIELPADAAIDLRTPEAWRGVASPALGWSALVLAALYHGIAEAAVGWTGRWLHERVPTNLGQPLASLPRMQEQFGRIRGLFLASDALLDRWGRRHAEAPSDCRTEDLGLVKQMVTGNAIAAVELCLELAGNHGLSRHNPLERHYRDVLCARVHTPQDDSARLAGGRLQLGLA